MAKVELKPGRFGMVVFIDGREVPNVRDIRFSSSVENMPSVDIEVLATDGLAAMFETSDVTINVVDPSTMRELLNRIGLSECGGVDDVRNLLRNYGVPLTN